MKHTVRRRDSPESRGNVGVGKAGERCWEEVTTREERTALDHEVQFGRARDRQERTSLTSSSPYLRSKAMPHESFCLAHLGPVMPDLVGGV